MTIPLTTEGLLSALPDRARWSNGRVRVRWKPRGSTP